MAEANPYAAPKAAIQDAPTAEPELATLWQRFAGNFVDGVVMTLAWVPGSVLAPRYLGEQHPLIPVLIVVPVLVLLGLQLWMVIRHRASIGKRVMKARMTRPDGGEAPVWRIVLLRALPVAVLSAVPVANLLVLVDALFIFGKPRRCLHDYLGGTIVVKAA
jgi:uncharacterized RDD family membrane protein YckC